MNVSLTDQILEAAHSGSWQATVQPVDLDSPLQNQFLLLLKPECFARPTNRHSYELIDLIIRTFLNFDVVISGVLLFAGELLSDRGTLERHYRVINRLSRRASSEITGPLLAELRSLVGAPVDAIVLGGHEVLMQESSLDSGSLNDLWSTKRAERLRSGLYAELHEMDGQPVIIVNGFHPNQLDNFTRPGQYTGVLIGNSELPWNILRTRMIGDTFPDRAASGSIRRALFDDKLRFGFRNVDESNNCVHMSAGPFEALCEIDNFLNSSECSSYNLESCRQAKHLRAVGWVSEVTPFLGNPSMALGSRDVTLHDITEGVDGRSAAHLAARYVFPSFPSSNFRS